MNYQLYFSERGIPLVYCEEPQEKPIITVENYCKWYQLYLVNPNGTVISYWPKESTLKKFGSESISFCCDHVFEPLLVSRCANYEGIKICQRSYEMIVGRWEIEILNKYVY